MLSFSPRPEAYGIDLAESPAQRYRILGQIATGSMAHIYLAEMRTGPASGQHHWRQVALKRLKPELQRDREFVQMFYDEARIASEMDHPNVVRIFELGELDGSLFISMELVVGVSLRQVMNRVQARGGLIPIPVLMRVACGALQALGFAHRATDAAQRALHIVHRDVSPQNLLIGFEGEVKLADFGVAKADRNLHKTRPGLVKGKFAYMAPEQIKGEHVDGRADLFALAETLFEAATLHHPFLEPQTTAALETVLKEEPFDPTYFVPGFPPRVRDILFHALEKDPRRRYPVADTMRLAIEGVLKETPAATERVAAFVRELFPEALVLLRQARQSHDVERLVRGLRAVEPALASGSGSDRLEAGGAHLLPAGEPAPRSAPPRPLVAGSTPPKRLGAGGDVSLVLDALDESQLVGTRPLRQAPRPEPRAPSFVLDISEPETPDAPDAPEPRRLETPVTGDFPLVDAPTMPAIALPRLDVMPEVLTPEPLPVPAVLTPDPAEPVPMARAEPSQTMDLPARWEHTGWTAEEILPARPGFHRALAAQSMRGGLVRRGWLVQADEAQAGALAQELRLRTELAHPLFPPPLEVVEEGPRPSLILPYAPGVTLRELIDRARATGTELPPPLVCWLGATLAGALGALHTTLSRGLGGLAAERIWLTRRGHLTLLELGELAIPAEGARSSLPAEEPPTPARDVYLLGSLLLEALFAGHTGALPLPDALEPGRSVSPVPLPEPVVAVLGRATAPRPGERYEHGAALEIDLERLRLRIGQPVTAAYAAAWLDRTLSATR